MIRKFLSACAAMTLPALVLLSVFCSCPALAQAPIYSTFGPDDFYTSNSGWTIGNTGVYVQALQFIPARSDVVQTIEIAAFRLAGGTALNVSLTTDAGGKPGAVIETVPVCCFGDVAAIQVANSVLRPLITRGTKYWLVVSPVAVGDFFGWCRNQELPAGLNAQQTMGGPWSVGFDWQGAMRISGEASTPASATSWGRLKSLYR